MDIPWDWALSVVNQKPGYPFLTGSLSFSVNQLHKEGPFCFCFCFSFSCLFVYRKKKIQDITIVLYLILYKTTIITFFLHDIVIAS